jgi:hypothetical protein
LNIPSGCAVQQLSTSNQRFLLGYSTLNGGKIFSAAQSLHMSGKGINEVYMGLSNIRGIAVDVWQSCQYWSDMDATMNVWWYFTGKWVEPKYHWAELAIRWEEMTSQVSGRSLLHYKGGVNV